MSGKEAKTDYIEEEFRQAISEIKEVVREGSCRNPDEADLLEYRPPQGGVEILA